MYGLGRVLKISAEVFLLSGMTCIMLFRTLAMMQSEAENDSFRKYKYCNTNTEFLCSPSFMVSTW